MPEKENREVIDLSVGGEAENKEKKGAEISGAQSPLNIQQAAGQRVSVQYVSPFFEKIGKVVNQLQEGRNPREIWQSMDEEVRKTLKEAFLKANFNVYRKSYVVFPLRVTFRQPTARETAESIRLQNLTLLDSNLSDWEYTRARMYTVAIYIDSIEILPQAQELLAELDEEEFKDASAAMQQPPLTGNREEDIEAIIRYLADLPSNLYDSIVNRLTEYVTILNLVLIFSPIIQDFFLETGPTS